MTGVAYPVIGELYEQRRPHHPGIPFKEFFCDCGIDGLAYVENDNLNILAVHSVTEGIGQFRWFIQECKKFYPFIRIWCVLNDDLRPILARYGFTKGFDADKFGQMQEVWDWSKP